MDPVIRACIADAGRLAQALGLGKVPGRIYAYLYFSQAPRGLAEMQADLRISKGSASMCVRQLEQWDAVQKVPVPGDRRDYYQANDWFGRVLKNVLTDLITTRFADRQAFYDDLQQQLSDVGTDTPDRAFIQERLQHIQQFEDKARKMWNNPLVQHLFR